MATWTIQKIDAKDASTFDVVLRGVLTHEEIAELMLQTSVGPNTLTPDFGAVKKQLPGA